MQISIFSLCVFSCNCVEGFTGQHCEVNFDECSSNPCDETGGICVDGINSYLCYCKDGFAGDRWLFLSFQWAQFFLTCYD